MQAIHTGSCEQNYDIPCRFGYDKTILSDILHDDVNIAIWQRQLPAQIAIAAQKLTGLIPYLQISTVVAPQSVIDILCREVDESAQMQSLYQDISRLIEMFCFLFDLKEAALRIKVLEEAMCPLFHVDCVPCRLVTTYYGAGTQWLLNDAVDRSKLGAGANGKPDDLSGKYKDPSLIQQMNHADVALLKGERWHGNEGKGLVHRSPKLSYPNKRLLVTIDF